MPKFDPRLKESIQASEAPAKRSGGGPWPWMLLVMVGIAVAIFLVPEDRPEQAVKPTPTVAAKPTPARPSVKRETLAPTTPPATTPTPGLGTAPAALPDTPASPDTPGAEARALIARLQGPDASAQAHAKAKEMTKAGKAVDAYLLDFYAARNAYGPAALALAELADPLLNQSHPVLDGPDAGQAIKWYRVAFEAGESTAVNRLAALRIHLTRLARSGDQDAERLLLQWQ